MDTIEKASLLRFSELIELLYQASTHPHGFQPFLELPVSEFNLADVALHIHNTTSNAVEAAWIAGPKTDVLIEFVENNLEEGNYIHDYIDNAPPSRFYTLLGDIGRRDSQYLTPRQKLVDKWFDDNQMLDVSSAVISRLENQIAMFSMHRDISAQAFSRDDVLILNELIPPHSTRV